ncbi:MAG: (Fe-S)-binding protein [Candidatus Helarchaeota archaeon]
MFEEFINFKKNIINNCTECGTCFKYCYAYKRTKFPIWKHWKDFFQTGEKSKEIKKFIKACIYCKYHEYACPNNIKLTELLPALRNDLSHIYPRFAWTPHILPGFLGRFLRTRRLYSFWRYMNNLLIPEKEREKWDFRRKPQKREVVFFSGCGIQLLPDLYYSQLEILEKLGIDYGLIEGHYNRAVCCGTVLFLLGNYKYGKKVLINLINEIKKYGTKKVIIHCPTCNWGLTQIAPNIIEDFDLEVIHASTYIGDLLKKNPKLKKMLKIPDKEIVLTIHDSCHLARAGDVNGIRNLLSQLPSTSISEMNHNKLNAICDLYCILRAFPHRPLDIVLNNNNIPISKEAIEANADILVSICLGCHALQSLFGQNFISTFIKRKRQIPLINWTSILAKYLGLKTRHGLNYWLKHIITIPFKDSLSFWILNAIKALIYGYLLNRIPPIRIPNYLKKQNYNNLDENLKNR